MSKLTLPLTRIEFVKKQKLVHNFIIQREYLKYLTNNQNLHHYGTQSIFEWYRTQILDFTKPKHKKRK